MEHLKAKVHFSHLRTWITKNIFSESFLLSSAKRMARAISRKIREFETPCTQIEAIKQAFDSFDETGTACWSSVGFGC